VYYIIKLHICNQRCYPITWVTFLNKSLKKLLSKISHYNHLFFLNLYEICKSFYSYFCLVWLLLTGAHYYSLTTDPMSQYLITLHFVNAKQVMRLKNLSHYRKKCNVAIFKNFIFFIIWWMTNINFFALYR